MDKYQGQEFSELSEVAIFNLIGEYAKQQGYAVKFFKVNIPIFNDNLQIEYKYMHYIHILNDNGLKVSIYYDKYCIGGYMGQEYYELYDMEDIHRYFVTNEEEMDMLDKTKELLHE